MGSQWSFISICFIKILILFWPYFNNKDLIDLNIWEMSQPNRTSCFYRNIYIRRHVYTHVCNNRWEKYAYIRTFIRIYTCIKTRFYLCMCACTLCYVSMLCMYVRNVCMLCVYVCYVSRLWYVCMLCVYVCAHVCYVMYVCIVYMYSM